MLQRLDRCFPELAFCLMLLALGFVGCGGDSGPVHHPVSGTVTYKGEPVTHGSIQFSNPEFGSGSAKLGEGGAYDVDGGLVAGNYKVMIVAPTPDTPPDFNNPQAAMRRPPEVKDIPNKYRSTATSGFTADVVEGDNEFTFDMQ